jgi:hypothetical protein
VNYDKLKDNMQRLTRAATESAYLTQIDLRLYGGGTIPLSYLDTGELEQLFRCFTAKSATTNAPHCVIAVFTPGGTFVFEPFEFDQYRATYPADPTNPKFHPVRHWVSTVGAIIESRAAAEWKKYRTAGQGSGHKTRAQRQQEAKERKRKYLDHPEDNLRDAVGYLAKNTSDTYAAQQVLGYHRALVKAYVEAGYEPNEAQGMARSVKDGGTRAAWLSGIDV